VSQENVEVVRAGLQYFVRTGEPQWSAIHQDVEIYDHHLIDAPEYRGWDGYERWVANWASVWSEFSLDGQEFIDAGDKVLAVFRIKAVSRGSGLTAEREDAMVCEISDGIVSRLDYYNNREQALKAVGLEE
jgi:ketosteroid isomerase-like protein